VNPFWVGFIIGLITAPLVSAVVVVAALFVGGRADSWFHDGVVK